MTTVRLSIRKTDRLETEAGKMGERLEIITYGALLLSQGQEVGFSRGIPD